MSYVDLHTHLLPGIDDGSPTSEETIRHARHLAEHGVQDVACTPHIKREHFPDIDVGELAQLRADTQRALDDEGIGVRLHPGGELAHTDALELDADDFELIAQGPAHARWMLLECPFEGLDDDFDDAVARLTDLGYGVLLAHPERVLGPIDRLRAHVESGALLQVNVSSLLGDHGSETRAVAERLVTKGLAYCLASDTHPGTREKILPLADDALRRLGVSEINAFRLTRSNPRFLLHEGNPRMPLPATEERVSALS